MERDVWSRREKLWIALVACIPLPLLSLGALAFPVPGAIDRAAATLIPFAAPTLESAPVDRRSRNRLRSPTYAQTGARVSVVPTAPAHETRAVPVSPGSPVASSSTTSERPRSVRAPTTTRPSSATETVPGTAPTTLNDPTSPLQDADVTTATTATTLVAPGTEQGKETGQGKGRAVGHDNSDAVSASDKGGNGQNSAIPKVESPKDVKGNK